jgi:predicted permease
VESFLQDIRYSFRTLRASPGFTAIAVLTLALGIGATTAIFSVVYGVLLRPLPYPRPDRLVAVYEVNTKGRPARLADPNFDDFRDQSKSFEAIAKYRSDISSVAGASEPTRTTVASVSPEFLRVFHVAPVRGRDFAPSDDQVGAARTVIVSYRYWRAYLGARDDLSQSYLKIDGTSYAVIGVLPSGFAFPANTDLWTAIDVDGENHSRTSHNASAVARLKDGVTVTQASNEVSGRARRIRDASAEQNEYLLKDGMVVPLRTALTGDARQPLFILLGAVGFLLLVACANVANLLLAQATARERELALRSALGAGRGRLVRQLLTETLILSVTGGGLGVLAAYWGVARLVALAPANLPRLDEVSINGAVLAGAFMLATLVATSLGVFVASRATSTDLRGTLVEGGRGSAGSRSTQRAGRVIVAAQIAITMVLVVGAGLLGRSLLKVLAVNPGFRVDHIVTMDVSLPWVSDPAVRARQGRFYADLISRLERIPGVEAIGAASALPMDGGLPDGLFVEMSPGANPKTFDDVRPLFARKELQGNADFAVVTAGYFQVLGIPLVRGRLFDDRDGPDAPHAAVISEALARLRWPNQDPLGRVIEFGNMDGDLRVLTVVGVVGDTHEDGLERPPAPTVYVNLYQRPRAVMTVAMASTADPRSITTAARQVLREADPELPPRFRTLSQVYSASLGSRRFNVILTAAFGLTALLLASAGVFGVMAYAVSRRTREIGVRVALGAASLDVLTMILGQGARTIGAGVVVGVALSLALTRTVQSLLFGVTATDPVTFGAVTLLLVGAALAACYIPARRATKVDPMIALRAD